jgi:hypothetical protein
MGALVCQCNHAKNQSKLPDKQKQCPQLNKCMDPVVGSLQACGASSIVFGEICPKTITLLLCKLIDNHQTCSTPITSPKQKKVLHPMTSPIKRNPVTSPKKHIIQRHHFGDLSCIHLS